MSEAIGTQQDEHVHFWNEPPQTLERLSGLLKTDDDYTDVLGRSTERPERHHDEPERHRKFRALLRQYLATVPSKKTRDHQYQSKLIESLSATNTAQPLVSAAREIMGLDTGDDLARITADKRERIQQWIEGLLAPDHYSPAFQYLMWGTFLRKRKQEERIEAPLPPFHDSVIGVMEELVTAYDRAAPERKERAVRAVVEHDNLFAFAREAGFTNRLATDIVKHLHPKSGSIPKLHDALDTLVTDVEYGEGPVVGQWVTITKTGINEQWPREMVQQFGANHLRKKGDGARMLQLISQNVPWCLNRYATAKSYLDRGKLLVFVTKSPKGWIPAFGIAFEQRDGDERIYEARGADDGQEINARFADVVAARPEIKADPHYKKRIADAQMLARMGKMLERTDAQGTTPALTKEQLSFLYELDAPITGFGRGGQPAIVKELKRGREPLADARSIFGAIATDAEHIGPWTGSYIGSLSKDVFDAVDALTPERRRSLKLFTRFPDGKVDVVEKPLVLGKKSFTEYWSWISGYKYATDYARSLVDPKNKQNKGAFEASVEKRKGHEAPAQLVEVTVGSLFPDVFNADGSLKAGQRRPNLDTILATAEKYGLTACPPELALEYVQAFPERVTEQALFFGMHTISDHDGYPGVFYAERHGGQPWLSGSWTFGDHEWDADSRFVLVRK